MRVRGAWHEALDESRSPGSVTWTGATQAIGLADYETRRRAAVAR